MKKILLISLMLIQIAGKVWSQTCLPNGVVFTTQQQIDNFATDYPGCTEVLGDVEINGWDWLEITNLSGLSQLTAIEGQLSILSNHALGSLSGLDGLTTLGGCLIEDNLALSSLDGLNNLTTVDGSFRLDGNDQLGDIEDLGNLESLSALELLDNNSLFSLSGLENVTTLDSMLFLVSNNNLQDLTGLDNVTTIGDMAIWTNAGIVSFTGLNNLTEVEGVVNISSNNNLADFSGLENLHLVGILSILSNYSITTLSHLSALDSVESVEVNGCVLIEDLSGLENIPYLLGLGISNNTNLQDLEAIENIDLSSASNLILQNNTALSFCAQENICNYLVTGGDHIISGNAPGCNDISEVLATCFEGVDHTNLIGQVIADADQSCDESAGEPGIEGWLVHLSNDTYSYAVSTDSLGNYWLPAFEGEYTLNAISSSAFWEPCFTDSVVVVSGLNDTIDTDFFMLPQGMCPYIDWQLNMPETRICYTTTISVDYCNYGALMAEDLVFSITLDTFMTIQSATLPYTVDADGNPFFELDSLNIFDCDQFTFEVFLDCDSVNFGDLQCIDVVVMPDDLCAPDSLWDGSVVTANGFCENDSTFFELRNIGDGDMFEAEQFRVEIIIDDIVLLFDVDDYQLTSGDSIMLAYENTGSGMRLEADQSDEHPLYSEVSAVVSNCNTNSGDALFNLMSVVDGDPYAETFCNFAVNSYDPNIKSAIPIGIGDNHEIEKNWELDYTIQFQNTGNAEAYIVVIRDTLSDNLDLTTLNVRGASHDFTWALNPNGELVITFDDINLPDSTTNEPESHGFVCFSVSPQQSLLPGASIENRVGIYFDFNDPIITNTVFHSIRKPVVASSEHLDWCAGESYENQLVLSDTSFQYLTEFVEYDSIHFVHLDVVEAPHSTVSAEVLIGEYLEGVLVLGDTIFTVSYSAPEVCDSLVKYMVAGLTSLDEIESFGTTYVYPNPVDDYLMVSNHQNGEAQRWTLVNHLGVQLWERNLSANEVLPKISMSEFPSGVYLLNVKTDAGAAIWKVVKRE